MSHAEGTRRRGSGVAATGAATLAAGLVAGVAGVALAPLGTMAVYVLAAFAVLAGVAGLIAPQVGPLVRSVTERLAPATDDRVPAWIMAGAGILAAAMAFVLAGRGLLGVAAALLLIVGSTVTLAAWPLVRALVLGPAGESRDGAGRGGPVPAAVAGVFAGGGAWVLAGMGAKGFIAAFGLVTVVILLYVAHYRVELFTFLTVCSLTLVLHKSLSSQDLQLSGGAISVYVTTFDLLVVLLYLLWVAEGTFASDVQNAWRSRWLHWPWWAALTLLPSLLVAGSVGHAAGELARMGWMYALFFWIAVRVRTVAHLWSVLAGLAVFVAVEFLVVVMQWRTGGVLGLEFLGVPQELGQRTTDSSTIGRPFGTIIHPVFMGASLGMVMLVALAYAIWLRDAWLRAAAAGVVLMAGSCLWISQTRASFVAAAGVGVVIVYVGLRSGAVTWRVVRVGVGLGVVAVLAALPAVLAKIRANFGTGHFWDEVASRFELNTIGWEMIRDHPLLGVGLNNFELVLPAYSASPVIFFGNPVHNLYLLVWAETGLIGLAGVVALGIALIVAAVRLARVDDPMLRPLGVGAAGAFVFIAIEELLGFSLRQDIPLALFWLLAGLVVAGLSMASSTPAAPASRRAEVTT